jgi:hypothetical protein
MPITVGYDLKWSVDGTASVSIAASGTILHGVVWDGANLKPVSSRSLSYKGAGTAGVKTTTTLLVYIMPTVVFNVATIGGPTFGLKAGAEALIATSSGDASSRCVKDRNLFAVNAQAQLIVGAAFSLMSKTKTFGPLTVLSTKRTVTASCDAAPSAVSAAAAHALQSSTTISNATRGAGGVSVSASSASPPAGIFPGMAYSGLLVKGPMWTPLFEGQCDYLLPVLALNVEMSFQAGVLNPMGKLIGRQWIGSVVQKTGFTGAGQVCVASKGFVMEGSDPRPGGFSGHNNNPLQPLPSLLDVTQCADGVSVLSMLRFQAYVPSSDYSVLAVQDVDGCLQANMRMSF